MTKSEFKRRLERIAVRFGPTPESFTFAMNVIHVVPWSDPLCGTWKEIDKQTPLFVRTTEFYCRDLAHFNELVDQYHAENDANLYTTDKE